MKIRILLSVLFFLNIGCQSLTATNKSKEKLQSKKTHNSTHFKPILSTNLIIKSSNKKDRNPALSVEKGVNVNSTSGTPFWKVEKDNQIFYIFGTIHTGVSIEDLQCSQIVQDKIKETDLLFVESFNPGTEYLYNDFEDTMRKLYLGSKEEKEQIMSQLSEETRERTKNRINIIKLMNIMNRMTFNINQGKKIVKDEGQFKDLSKESQNFLIQYGLYGESKSYLDYYFDIFFIASYDVFFSQKKYLDVEILKLALDHNIPIASLDANKNTLADMEKEIEDLYEMEGQDTLVRNTDIDQIIADYENIKQSYSDSYSSLISDYKSKDWKSLTGWFRSVIAKVVIWFIGGSADALFKNRNESWVEKMLLSSENQSIFIAAGYAHFFDSDNVLDLLESEGFKITLIDEESCQF